MIKHALVYSLYAACLVCALFLAYDLLAWLPRKFGLTTRRGVITTLVHWLLVKLMGSCPNDYGEFRNAEWKRKHLNKEDL